MPVKIDVVLLVAKRFQGFAQVAQRLALHVDHGLTCGRKARGRIALIQHDGGAQITASHNPGAYNGIKLVARQAIPLSGDAGISDEV